MGIVSEVGGVRNRKWKKQLVPQKRQKLRKQPWQCNTQRRGVVLCSTTQCSVHECLHSKYMCTDGWSVWGRSMLASAWRLQDAPHQKHRTFKNYPIPPTVSGIPPTPPAPFTASASASALLSCSFKNYLYIHQHHVILLLLLLRTLQYVSVADWLFLSGDQCWGWGAALQWSCPHHQEEKSRWVQSHKAASNHRGAESQDTVQLDSWVLSDESTIVLFTL